MPRRPRPRSLEKPCIAAARNVPATLRAVPTNAHTCVLPSIYTIGVCGACQASMQARSDWNVPMHRVGRANAMVGMPVSSKPRCQAARTLS